MINIKKLDKQKDVIVIFGATASGKSEVSLKLAKEINGIIINSDSSQIYKEAPILSNIPSQDEFQQIPHKLFSYLSLVDESSVIDWLTLCSKEIELCREQEKTPIIVGGSGLYISSLLYGVSDIPSDKINKQKSINLYNEIGYNNFFDLIKSIDPEFIAKTDDPQRLIRAYEVYLCSNRPFSSFQNMKKKKYINANFINIFIDPNRDLLYKKINERTLSMFDKGALNEASEIFSLTTDALHLKKILGLKDLLSYFNEEITLLKAIELIQQKTRNYAKRQVTWFNHQIKEKNIIKHNNDIFYKK